MKTLPFSIHRCLVIFIVCANFLPAEESRHALYGYSQTDLKASSNSAFPSTFLQRRVNLIGDIFVDDRVRTLVDIEFEGDASHSSQEQIGTIKLSRAWGEYTMFPELKIRVGKMLTPFGLYNVVHDFSATYFPIDPPPMYLIQQPFPTRPAQRFFGKYFTGIEALGTYDINASSSQLEYSLGIGNGRGAQADGSDSNNDKCILARIAYRPSFVEGMQVGMSWYADRNVNGIGVPNDYERSSAIDVQYENSKIQIQSEMMTASFTDTLGNARRALITYCQFAYTLFERITPYTSYTVTNYNIKTSNLFFERFHIGINIAVTGHLFIKTEIQFHSAEDEKAVGDFQIIQGSVAIAF